MIEEREKVEHLFTSEEKLAFWGYGEWVEEPDLVEWEYKGIPCAIERIIFLGHLCGYVAMPEGHPWLGKDLDHIDADVHGELSYKREEEGVLWIGFDCAHAGDYQPYKGSLHFKTIVKQNDLWSEGIQKELERLIENERRIGRIHKEPEKTYKNIAFVKTECEKLVDQMLKAGVEE
jgi:hypothetical protein